MDYRVITCEVSITNGTDFDRAVSDLSREVNRMLAHGYEPTGGVAIGYTQATRKPFLFQAVWRRDEPRPAAPRGAA